MGNILGGGKSAKTEIDRSKFDLTSQADAASANAQQQYQNAAQRQQFANNANQQLITQLQQQANGQAPSIAEAQLRSTTNRNLAQTMAAAAAQRGGNPALAQRQIQNQRAASNRDMAEQGAVLRLQEQNQNQNLLASQLNQAQAGGDSMALNSNNAGFGYQQAAKQLGAQGENLQATLNQQTTAANTASQNQMVGNLIGSAAKIGAGVLSGGATALPSVLSGATNSTNGGGQKVPYPTPGFFSEGGVVEAPEVVPGDSPANDVKPIMASGGEMVVPKSVVEQGPKAVHNFAKALLEHAKAAPEAKKYFKGYEAVVAARGKKA